METKENLIELYKLKDQEIKNFCAPHTKINEPDGINELTIPNVEFMIQLRKLRDERKEILDKIQNYE